MGTIVSMIQQASSRDVSIDWFARASGVTRSRLYCKFLEDHESEKIESLCQDIRNGTVEMKMKRNSSNPNYYEQLVKINRGIHPRNSWLNQKLGAPSSTIASWRTGVVPSPDYNNGLMQLCTAVLNKTAAVDSKGTQYQQYKRQKTGANQRSCLKCHMQFESYGPQNRQCQPCKSANAKFLDHSFDLTLH